MESSSNSAFKAMDKNSDSARWYKQVASQVGINDPKPKSILIISAHWETTGSVYVTNQFDHKELYYDYYGFPDYTYKLNYPAKGK